MKQPILVYRDRLIPRSEAAFMRRQYVGFERLEPTWIGWHEDEGRADLQARTLTLGAGGVIGAVERFAFKQLGLLPSTPDLRALKPRLIHAHFGRGGALALPLARKLGIPLVVSFHGGDATKAKHYRRQIIPTLYQRRLETLQREATFFVCVSDFIRDTLLARGFPAEKLRVVRYGIDLDPPPPGPDAGAGFLFVGRFVEKKGVPVLIEALRRLADRGIALPLTLVGDGSIGPILSNARPACTVFDSPAGSPRRGSAALWVPRSPSSSRASPPRAAMPKACPMSSWRRWRRRCR